MIRIATATMAAALAFAGCVVIDEESPMHTGAPPEMAIYALQSREQIRELLHAYGRTLDARDFAGFAELRAGRL
jgi:hypothetical protein